MKMIKAKELPDMSQWSDEQIEEWLDTHDTSEILKNEICNKKENNVRKNEE